ncbi:MAG: FkbM family methyltransferase [Arenicella sp.]
MRLINTLAYILDHPLNKGRRFSTLSRFVWWQLKSRLSSSDIQYNWVNNAKILASTGETGVTGNIYCGLHEFSDMGFLLHVLRPDDLFVDIGANVGSYTVLASASIGAKTICFEPIPLIYMRLISNIDVNNMAQKVTAYNVALADTPGELTFSTDQNCMNHVIADHESSPASVIVKVRTLDECLKEAPFLIKIDVEGYEMPALRGAVSTLSNQGLCAVILELNGSGRRYGFDDAQISQLMFEYGFESYEYEPFKRQLTALKGKHSAHGNTLFLRDLESIQRRIDTASKVEVHGTIL